MVKVPQIVMNNGVSMPAFGLGTFEVSSIVKLNAFTWHVF